MSVTFAPTSSVITAWTVECVCGAISDNHVETYDDAVALLGLKTPIAGCEQSDYCRAYTHAVTEGPEHEGINMANGNAVDLLHALGLTTDGEFDWSGCLPAEDFLGRVLVALAIIPISAERLTHEVPGHGARMVECGRETGYVQARLDQLREVAEFAITHSRDVSWG